jgi:hypothetical protein
MMDDLIDFAGFLLAFALISAIYFLLATCFEK